MLRTPVLEAARPRVLTGRLRLDREVRWVHVTELSDIARLLRAGDLVLTTGIALPEDTAGVTAFADSLGRVGAAGLVVELGRRWTGTLPASLVEACGRADLPLVELQQEVSFAAVAQSVGEQVVDRQVTALRESEQVHDVFTDLAISEAGPGEILQAVRRLAGATAVVEDADHHIVDHLLGPDGDDSFRHDWPSRSRRLTVSGRTSWDAATGWLVTHLGAPERRWGRLLVRSPRSPEPRTLTVVERGAGALALHLLHTRDRQTLTRRRHGELIDALLERPEEAGATAERLGFPLSGRVLVAVSGRPVRGTAEDLATAAVSVAEGRGLVAVADVAQQATQRTARILLSVPAEGDPSRVAERVDDWAGGTTRRAASALAASRPVAATADVATALRESAQVLRGLGTDAEGLHRWEDVGLRGLLTLLGDDERVTLFAERQLHDLEAHDAHHGTELLTAVAAHVHHVGNKTAAAASLFLSRPAFYARLSRAEEVLGRPLDDPDTVTSLRLALLTREMTREVGP